MTRRDALGSRLLVAGGPVDLSGQKQPWQLLDLERRQQLAGIHVVVFDGIAETLDGDPFEAWNRAQEGFLHLRRQRGGDAVGVDHVVVEALGLQKNLVPGTASKTHNFVLDRRAVARPHAADLARIHGRTNEIGPDDRVGRLGCGGDAALDLRIGDAIGQERERHRRVVAGLHLQARPVDGTLVEAGGSAGLEAAEAQIQRQKALREAICRWLAVTPGGGLLLAAMDQPAQEGAGGQHHGTGPDFPSVGRHDAGSSAVFNDQVLNGPLDHLEVGRGADRCLHGRPVELAVGLGARAVHRRPLGPVEQAELDAGRIRHPAHQPIQRIDLPHQVALAEPANGRIARHLADGSETGA